MSAEQQQQQSSAGQKADNMAAPLPLYSISEAASILLARNDAIAPSQPHDHRRRRSSLSIPERPPLSLIEHEPVDIVAVVLGIIEERGQGPVENHKVPTSRDEDHGPPGFSQPRITAQKQTTSSSSNSRRAAETTATKRRSPITKGLHPAVTSLSSITSPCLQIQIGDESLPRNVVATIFLFDTPPALARIRETQLMRPGDVIRFNGISLMRNGQEHPLPGGVTSRSGRADPEDVIDNITTTSRTLQLELRISPPQEQGEPEEERIGFSALPSSLSSTGTFFLGDKRNPSFPSEETTTTVVRKRSRIDQERRGEQVPAGEKKPAPVGEETESTFGLAAAGVALQVERGRQSKAWLRLGHIRRITKKEESDCCEDEGEDSKVASSTAAAAGGPTTTGNTKTQVQEEGLSSPKAEFDRYVFEENDLSGIDAAVEKVEGDAATKALVVDINREKANPTNSHAAASNKREDQQEDRCTKMVPLPAQRREALVAWYESYRQKAENEGKLRENDEILARSRNLAQLGGNSPTEAAEASAHQRPLLEVRSSLTRRTVPNTSASRTTTTADSQSTEKAFARPLQLSSSSSSLPTTTRRSLAEVEASSSSPPGMLSNIDDVRVTHCDSRVVPRPVLGTSFLHGSEEITTRQQREGIAETGHIRSFSASSGEEASSRTNKVEEKETSSTSSSISERRHQQPLQQEQQDQQVIGFATLTDSSGAVLSIVDPGNRFGFFFQTAQNDGRALNLSNVLSKKQRNLYGRQLAAEAVVLWPTKQTSVSLLSTENEDDNAGDGNGDQDNQPSTTAVAGNARSLEANNEDEEDGSSSNRHHISIESPVLDISWSIIRETRSIWQFVYSDDTVDLQETMLSPDGRRYRQAMVRLEPIESLVLVDETGQQIGLQDTFLADGDVMRALCGDMSPADWFERPLLRPEVVEVEGSSNMREEPKGQDLTVERTTTSQMGRNAVRFIRALLREAISLRWTIDLGRKPAEIVKVAPPQLYSNTRKT